MVDSPLRARFARLRAFVGGPVGTVLKAAVSLGILGWFVAAVDWPRLVGIVGAVHPLWIVLLVALALARIVPTAWRFRYLSRPFADIDRVELGRQYLVASLFNNVLPSAVGGDAVRLFMLAEKGLAKRDGLPLMLIERGMGLVALGVLVLVSVPFFTPPTELLPVVWTLALGVAVALPALWFAGRLAQRVGARLAWMERSTSTAQLVLSRPGTLLVVLAWSLAVQGLAVAMTVVVGEAFGLSVPWGAYLQFVPLVWLVSMLPISLGGVGLRELAFVYLFGLVGLEREPALALSIGTWFAMLVPGLVGAVIVARQGMPQGWGDPAEPNSVPD